MKMVIGSKSELSDVWTRHFSRRSAADPMPEIDFEKEMVIWVASGVQGSGGYSTAVTQIVEVENELNIQVTFSCPPPGAITTCALTQPHHVIRLPKSSGSVKRKIPNSKLQRRSKQWRAS
eukprot:symbB.v1.2.035140.t1/scaffold4668.1/size36730/2